jgi:hypothetical protein
MTDIILSRRALCVGAVAGLAVTLLVIDAAKAQEGEPKPQVTHIMMLQDAKGEIFGIGFRFVVKDVENIAYNKTIAEKILPDAIAYAEARKISLVNLRAYQVGIQREYGYTWKKDPTAGTWSE